MIWYAAAVSAAYLPGIYSAALMPRWWVIVLGLPFFAVNPMRPVIRWLWLAGLAWAFAMLFISGHPWEGSLNSFYLLVLFAVAMVGANQVSLSSAMLGLIVGLLPSTLLLLPQTFGWSPVVEAATPAGFFFNREILAEFAAPLLVWAIVRRTWWFLVPALPVALCHSRIALLVVACALLYAWWPQRWLVRIGILVAIAAAALGSVIYLGLASAGLRMVLWGAAILSLTPMGHGLGWWHAAHPFPIEEFVHSDVLQFGVELGLGGLCFIAASAISFCLGRGSTAECAAFVALSIETVVSFPLHMPATAFMAALLAGYMACDWRGVRRLRLPRRARDSGDIEWSGALYEGGSGSGAVPFRPAST